ncbi:hypothetical protein [Moraxella lacunata]
MAWHLGRILFIKTKPSKPSSHGDKNQAVARRPLLPKCTTYRSSQ